MGGTCYDIINTLTLTQRYSNSLLPFLFVKDNIPACVGWFALPFAQSDEGLCRIVWIVWIVLRAR